MCCGRWGPKTLAPPARVSEPQDRRRAELMDQKVDALTAEEIAHLNRQRDWVRDHYVPESRAKYELLEEKLSLLERILEQKWIEPHETWKLQSLGVTFGDALAQSLGLEWVAVKDEDGRGPALKDPVSSVIVFPLTMISKRVEQGEAVDIVAMFRWVCKRTPELRAKFEGGKTH